MFEKFLRKFNIALDFYYWLAKSNILTLHIVGDGIRVNIDMNHTMPAEYRSLLEAIIDKPGECLELYSYMAIIGSGPKVVRFNQFDFEMLEHIDLNIEIDDFDMPFTIGENRKNDSIITPKSAVVIELPPEYCRGKTVDCPQAGVENPFGMVYPQQHHPMFVTVVRVGKIIIPQVTLSSYQTFKTCLYWTDSDYKDKCTIQEILDRCRKDKLYRDSLECSDMEIKEFYGVVQSSLNAVMLMEEIGLKKKGVTNKGYYGRLREWYSNGLRRKNLLEESLKVKMDDKKLKRQIQLLNHEKDKLRRIERDILLLPVHYELASRPLMYRLEGDTMNVNSSDSMISKIISPHYRRGFYKMQHYGPGNSLRKRIRIPPTFVNARFLYN